MNHATLRRTGLSFLIAICAAAVPAVADELDDVLARFDVVQNSVLTLRAEFTETTINQLLKDPLVAEGLFYMTKPDAIRWEYATPEEMKFVIAQDRYTGYYPSQQRAEQRSVKRWSERIFRFIGLGQGSQELRKFYDITLVAPVDGSPLHHLLLSPKKKRVRRLVDEVHFFVDPQTFLPARVEYLTDTGSRVIEFQVIQLNPDLAASLYEVELPAGIKITEGFGGLPGLGAPEAAH